MSGLPSVLEVLRTRRDSGSVPGERDDGFRVALAIEGGGNRAAYSAGMALGLDEAGLTNSFDAIYGTSGGALNAAWLLTGEAQRWLPSWAWDEVGAAGVTDPRRMLRGGVMIDLQVLRTATLEEPSRLIPTRGEGVVLAPYFLAFARGARRSYDVRHHTYADDDLRLSSLAPHLAQVRPPLGSPDVSRLSRDADAIRGAIEIGRSALHTMLEAPTSVDD